MNLAIKPGSATLIGLCAVLVTLLAGCGAPDAGAGSARTLQVVAAENFWGSIAAQLGGSHVAVTSIVTNPNADPHEYESSTGSARVFAAADYVILNGAGYDDWGSKLLAANPSPGRKELTVASLLHKKTGDNPHFWYNPDWVEQVADAMTAGYKAEDPADSDYFDRQRAGFRSAMQPYHERIGKIRASFSGVAVGATENIVAYLTDALGLRLISPPEFMKAVAEGSDPPAQAVAEFQNQVETRQIKLLLYNLQTATNITDDVKGRATAKGIPAVGVSETLQPIDATFADWQEAQLASIEKGLSAGATTQ